MPYAKRQPVDELMYTVKAIPDGGTVPVADAKRLVAELERLRGVVERAKKVLA